MWFFRVRLENRIKRRPVVLQLDSKVLKWLPPAWRQRLDAGTQCCICNFTNRLELLAQPRLSVSIRSTQDVIADDIARFVKTRACLLERAFTVKEIAPNLGIACLDRAQRSKRVKRHDSHQSQQCSETGKQLRPRAESPLAV